MRRLLKGAHLVDPMVGIDRIADVLIEDGVIAGIGENLAAADAETVDLAGKVLVPGLVDVHVHLRDPGYEYKETIASGTRAAAHGGFTGVAPMPNTLPTCDTGSRVAYVREKAASEGLVHVYPVGAISKGLGGTSLSEMGDMVRNGAVAFSDDGRGVQDDGLMRRAMDYAKMFGTAVMSHCQSESLTGSGVVNEGVMSTRLGLAGWPAEGEEIQIARDIALCRLTGCHLHIQHLTTACGLAQIRKAKAEGLPVTCEATPHHLFLDETMLDERYDTNLKMNPPLRTPEDRAALVQGLVDGTIDCIATDHAPHAAHEKAVEFELAPFGTTGLETALPLVMTELIIPGIIGYADLVRLMADGPRRVLGLERVGLQEGSAADLTIIDPGATRVITMGWFQSKAGNSAFLGRELSGFASEVYVDGEAVMAGGEMVK